MLDEIFVGKTVKRKKVIRDYAKSISYFTMDNECHANICVFVQNSPDSPPPPCVFNGVTVERPEVDAKPLGTIFFVRKRDS